MTLEEGKKWNSVIWIGISYPLDPSSVEGWRLKASKWWLRPDFCPVLSTWLELYEVKDEQHGRKSHYKCMMLSCSCKTKYKEMNQQCASLCSCITRCWIFMRLLCYAVPIWIREPHNKTTVHGFVILCITKPDPGTCAHVVLFSIQNVVHLFFTVAPVQRFRRDYLVFTSCCSALKMKKSLDYLHKCLGEFGICNKSIGMRWNTRHIRVSLCRW